MTNIQELEIEFEGMLGTIKQYSCDPYVISYLDGLKVKWVVWRKYSWYWN